MNDQLSKDVLAGNRRALAKAITLLESQLPSDKAVADFLLESLLPAAGKSIRIGISGPPGVGKSTLIEALGKCIIGEGHRLAVLAVDPTSKLTGGSILGDRVRMENLSKDARVFIRPSPSGLSLGGVARHTRDAMIACEAGGYDVILVETVGVGQSETAVAGMVDLFLILQLPNSGDEIQGMKRGILELADVVAVTKADGPLVKDAKLAKGQLDLALGMTHGDRAPKVLMISSTIGTGVADLWQCATTFIKKHQTEGTFALRRAHQASAWFREELNNQLHDWLMADQSRKTLLIAAEQEVKSGKAVASSAAGKILQKILKP